MLLWAIWLILVVVTFAIFETRALIKGTPTLSRWVWTVSIKFPAFPWIAGVLTGFLAAHFWWGGALICYAPVN